MVALMVVLSMAGKLFFSFTFWLASLHKLNNLENFATILGDYGVPEYLPRKFMAVVIGSLECALAVLLLIPAVSVLALQAMMLMLALYTVALLYVYRNGIKLRDCGCGTKHQANQVLTRWPMVRNGLLISLMVLVVLFPPAAGAVYALHDWLVIVPMTAVFLLAYWTIEEMRSNHLQLATLQKYDG